MSIPQRISSVMLIAFSAALLATGWISTALAQADTDGDAFDGDEAALPIVLGLGVLAIIAWLLFQRRSPKSRQ
jgi:hypothetical protein